MRKYIAKKDTWFVEGSECEFLCDVFESSGLFRGPRKCENPASEAGHPLGEVYDDEEVCTYDEFEISE